MPHAIGVGCPAMTNEAKAFEGRTVSYLPVSKQVFQNGIQLLFGWVPRLSEVVVEFHLVHGEESNVCICRGSQQDALGIGEEVHGLLQKLDARHLLYVLGNEQEGHRFIAQLELFQRGKRLTAGGCTHDAKVSTILAP